MRISDWSSDVCSSDLIWETTRTGRSAELRAKLADQGLTALSVPEAFGGIGLGDLDWVLVHQELGYFAIPDSLTDSAYLAVYLLNHLPADVTLKREWLPRIASRSEEPTSELQSLMRHSYAVFCLKQKLTTSNQSY